MLRATGLIESSEDEPFHRYTRLAARLVGAPVAVLSLVEQEHEYLLSATGLTEPLTCAREIPLADSISRHVIAGHAPLTVADALQDPLLAGSSALAGLGIVAYAGAPFWVQGQPLGVLGVADRRRREWAAPELAALTDLAAAVSAEIELRLTVRSLHVREEEGVDDLLAHAGDMILTLAPGGRILHANRVLEAALGYGPGELEEQQAIELVAPEDRESYLQAAGRMMVEGAVADFETHLLTSGGDRRLMRGSGNCRYGDRVPLSVCLVFRDVTAQRQAQDELALLQRVTRGVTAAEDLSAAMRLALAEMCAFGGWPYGEVWLPAVDGSAEQCQRWVDDPGLAEFGRAWSTQRVQISTGVAGQAWTVRAPTRFDLDQEKGVPRSAEATARVREALRSGLRTALAVPIIAGEETLGLFVFAARAGDEVHEERTAALATVATQIGPVVQRRRAEALALVTEARLRDLVDSVNELVMTFAPDGRITFANRAAKAALRYGEEELRALSLLDILHPEGRERVRVAIERVMAGESVSNLEARLHTRDGRIIDVEGSASARVEGGRPVAVRGYFRDVTERRRAEDELRRTAQMLDLAHDAVIIYTLPDGLVTYWNRGAERLYGWARAEALGRELSSLLSTSFPASPEEVRAVVLRDGRWEGQLRHRCRGETVVTVESHWTLLREDGRPAAVLEINTDITERKRAQELFGAVLAAATENAIVATDTAGTIQAFNAGAERMLGYTAAELVGKATPAVLHDRAEILARAVELGVEPGREVFVHEIVQGRAETREWTYVRKDGTRLPVSVSATAMRDEHGEVRGFIGIATDISERKQVEQALRAARDAAESATRAKSEFLANMSHEIRTPMNAILGMTELLVEMEPTPEQRQYVRLVHDAAESLLQVINDILDFSRIEAGQLVLDAHPFRLRDAFGDAVSTLAVRAREKRVELAYRVHPDVPDALIGDLGRLRQVLMNLVGNAIKFTDEGEVVVDVSAQPEAGGGVRLQLEVRDTGIGIPADRQQAIFEPFTQADASTTRRFGGSGLGLTISRKILSLMGGTIALESAPGRGSTFRVIVPLRRDPAPALEPADAAAGEVLRGVRVLVVDDNATHRLILTEAVSRRQMRGTAVPAADTALLELRAAARAGDPYRLVLLDAVMPGMDGFQLAGAIRTEGPIAAPTVMLLSSAGDSGDVVRCRELGISRYLAKPIKESELVRVMTDVLAGEGREERQTVPARSGGDGGGRPVPGAGLRVLLAEDNLVNQKVARAILERHGHAVVVASNGREVVDLVRRGGLDVVLMDAQMPELGGLEATGLIREHERSAGGHLPIIAVTAHALKGDRERCLAAGMDGYLTKPLRVRDLLDELARVVRPAVPVPGDLPGPDTQE